MKAMLLLTTLSAIGAGVLLLCGAVAVASLGRGLAAIVIVAGALTLVAFGVFTSSLSRRLWRDRHE